MQHGKRGVVPVTVGGLIVEGLRPSGEALPPAERDPLARPTEALTAGGLAPRMERRGAQLLRRGD